MRSARFNTGLLGLGLGAIGLVLVAALPAREIYGGTNAVAIVVAISLLYVIAEAGQFHVEVRHQTHSVMVTDLPLVLGLFLLPPAWVVAARLVAALVTFAMRRPAAVKIVFNLGLYTFEVGLGALVLTLLGAGDGLAPRDWLIAFAAILVVDVGGALAVAAAMSLLQGPPKRRDLLRMIGSVTLSGLITTTFALMAVIVVRLSVAGLGLLAVLVVVLALAHRAYYALLRRHTDLGQLFSFTQTVGTAETSDDMVNTLLRQARDLLQAESAVLRLPPEPGDGLPLVPVGEPLLVERHTRDPLMQHWLTQSGVRDALLGPLRDGATVVGVLQVSNRLGEASTFTRDDLRLLQTLAAHAEVIWHNGRLLEQLRHDAHHDALTGLGNRSRFLQRVTALLSELANRRVARSSPRFSAALANRDDETCEAAVLLLDLDRFKEVNDTLGHPVGDALLQQVAARLLAHVPPEAVVSRLGGDEFAILLPACTSAQEAISRAEAARAGLTGPFEVQGTFLDVGASVGVALVPADGHDADTLMKHVDVAMYAAKRSTSGVARYRRDDDNSSLARLALAGELRRAMDEDQIELHYQPKVSLDTGEVIGFEALARWRHPDRGLMMPDEFIPLAEQTGLIGRLTHIALRQALEQAGAWRGTSAEVGVAVNLSVRRLLEPDLPTVVGELLAGAGVPAHRLTLEITESNLMTDPDAAQRALLELRDIGVRLSVDDFGTGYSALAYLQRLPLDEVKIDKSFVIPMMTDPSARAIVRAIVELAHTLDLTVVAEGVEHEAGREALRSMGCDVMQGYLIARPLRAEQVLAWLSDRSARRAVPPTPRTHLPRH